MARNLILSLISAIALYAQSSTGTLTGIVSDPSQARLADVVLKLANEETGVALSAKSTSSGEYTFPLLPSGTYRLDAELGGFQRSARTGIAMELGRTVRLDIILQLGQVTESVEVSGAAPLLESESATVGQFIENKTIADMPLNGRRVGDLLGLMGNGVYIRGDVIRPRVSIGGGRADQQQWLLDGVNSSNIALEVPQALFNPPVEAVQEIRIQQSVYSAEFGNSSSGVVAMTTRSGTNKYTGLLYEYLRNDRLDARNFFAASKPTLRWNVFGGALGGPVIKNRTFFFSHVEFQRQRVGVVRNLTVPTVLQRAGNFSQTTNAAGVLTPVFDPATYNAATRARTPFAGNIVPPSRFDPVGAKIASYFPVPTNAPINLAGAQNFNRNAVNALNITTWTSKGDHIFSDRDRVSVRYLLHDFPTYITPAYDEPAADPNASNTVRRAHSLLLNETHTFSPTMLNDFRFNWQPRSFHPTTLSIDQGWPAKLGLKGVSERAFPRVNVASYAALGSTAQERVQVPIHDTHIVDTLSLFRGKHSFKAGGEIRLARNVDDLNSFMSGQFSFAIQPTSNPVAPGNTGNALASLFLGFPNSANVLDSDLLDRRAKYFSLFLQDDWKLSQNLTLNIGLRWEAHTPKFDAANRMNGFDATTVNPVSLTPGIVTFAGLNGLGSQLYNGDWNNFMPRIGLAWKPKGRTGMVIRTGAGIFYGVPLPGSNNNSAGFAAQASYSTPDNGITAPFYMKDGFPGGLTSPVLGPAYGAVPVGQAAALAFDFVETERSLGYTMQWNFSLQQDIGRNSLVEISYLGTVGHKLNGPNTNINQVRPELMGPGNAQSRRPFPQFGNISTVAPMWGNSSYHGVNFKYEKRFSDGLNLLANYTFSKFIDDVVAAQEIGATPGIQNYYDRRSEKALSGNDVRNRFAFSSVYELPWGKARKYLNQGPAAFALGGWNIGAILTLQQGSPFGLTTQVNTLNAFSGGQRVNVLRDPELAAGQRTVQRYFDTEAVVAPPQFTFGNAGRSLLTGPGFANVNLSLLKSFKFVETWNLQFRLEAFNALNRANFEEPGTALGAPNFGVIGSAQDARSMQLGLKLTF
ncbi:MAG: TonB-dependent receptor [Acidobacteriia bacterium]|nr:TonB-dependent receptor [Terriglobia bacterium]